MIRIDSNHAYSLTSAKLLAAGLEEFEIRSWEDPVATFEEMARLRRHTAISFSSHNLDITKAASLSVPDAIVSNIANHGGFLRAQRVVGALEIMGIDYWCYSGDTGIGTAAYLHLCAATPWIREPNQSLLRLATDGRDRRRHHAPGEQCPQGPRRTWAWSNAGPGWAESLSSTFCRARSPASFRRPRPARTVSTPAVVLTGITWPVYRSPLSLRSRSAAPSTARQSIPIKRIGRLMFSR